MTRDVADAPTIELGALQEHTRAGSAYFDVYQIDLVAELTYEISTSIVVGGATALVELIDPDGFGVNGLDCASGTCPYTHVATQAGTHLLVLGSYGDDRLTYEVLVEEAPA